mmetsp:Transcript_31273/g.65884  ORF Transcript_31273/g.65884 Transcript_31273/m.65884 type:complete len:668 (+) Transcript_31273:211-2214(+)
METSTHQETGLGGNDEHGRPVKLKRTLNCEGGDHDDAAANNASNDDASTLPPEVWATVMNYLDYQSVLSCAATSKTILHDAMPLVTTLHIDKSSQLNALASRFRDVREINIFSLLRQENANIKVDCNTVMKTTLFLSRFSKLEKVFLGGRDSSGETIGYGEPGHIWDDVQDKKLVMNLMDQLSKAFQCNFLPKSLLVLGLRCPRCYHGAQGNSTCPSCQLACKNWPLEHVINFNNEGSSQWTKREFACCRPNCLDVCLTRDQIESIIETRSGGHDLLHSESRLLYLLGQGSRYDIYSDDGTLFYYVEFFAEDYDDMERAIKVADLDVKELTREDVSKALMRSFASKDDPDWIPPKSQCYLGRDILRYLKKCLKLPIYEEDWLDELVTNKQNLPQIIKVLKVERSGNIMIQVDCLFLLSQLLVDVPTIQQAIDMGILPLLVDFLNPQNKLVIMVNAAKAVYKICIYGTVAHAQALMETGVIPKLVHHLSLADEVVAQNIALALASLASKSTFCRDAALRAEIMPPLLRLLKSSNQLSTMQTVSEVIATLCQGDPKPDFALVEPCLEPLSHLLLSDDEMVLKNSCSALGIFCCSSEYAIGVGIYPRLVQLLGHSSEEVQDDALKTIRCLVGRDKTLIQPLISNEVLSSLMSFMSSCLAQTQIFSFQQVG